MTEYYDALKARWATLSPQPTDGPSVATAIAELNALMIPGPYVDVSARQIRMAVYAAGEWDNMLALSEESPSADADRNRARRAATQLIKMADGGEDLTTSNLAMRDALMADLGRLVSIGIITTASTTVVAALVQPMIRWMDATVEQGGVGMNPEHTHLGAPDLVAAGLLTSEQTFGWGLE